MTTHGVVEAGRFTAEQRRGRMRRIARAADVIIIGFSVVTILFEAYLGLDHEALAGILRSNGVSDTVEPGSILMFAAWLIQLVPVVIFLLALWAVRQILHRLSGQPIFDPALPHLLRRLGYLAFAAALATMVARTLTILVLSLDNPAGQRKLAIGISSGEVTLLVAGLLFLALALVMQEALLLEEDNRSIV